MLLPFFLTRARPVEMSVSAYLSWRVVTGSGLVWSGL